MIKKKKKPKEQNRISWINFQVWSEGFIYHKNHQLNPSCNMTLWRAVGTGPTTQETTNDIINTARVMLHSTQGLKVTLPKPSCRDPNRYRGQALLNTRQTNVSIQINQSTNWVKVQQLLSLSNRVPHSNIKQIGLFQRGKDPKRRKLKFCLYIPEHLPYCMEPLGSQMSIPCSSCQAPGQPGLLWVILQGRYLWQVAPAAATALPENSSLPGQLVTSRKTPGWPHQHVLLSSSSSHSPQDRSVNQDTRSWARNSDFILKVRRQRRWQTHVLKEHLAQVRIQASFTLKEEG